VIFEELHTMIETYERTRNADLEDEIDRMEIKLGDQWQWFRDNPRHPDGGEKHEDFIRTLRTYLATYDRWYIAENGTHPCH
jgi:hypothetical protein